MADRREGDAARGGRAAVLAVAALHWAAVASLAGAFVGAGIALWSGLE
ncbi:hypothetical protein GCM10009416_07070 [Craurococcus roseus]|uniref:Uncharacterized protein n=1 Tax=Craurococcus roseus TaxID=77585 RepID=A0ABN1EPB1_9PROT